MISVFGRALAAGGMILLGLAARADDSAPSNLREWSDTFVARVEALAVLQTLNAELLSHDSATSTLEHWCDDHRLASPARIVAARVLGIDKPPSAEQRQELRVTATDTVRYRHVRLYCGGLELSEADNWYVPGRLTPAMNHQLESTDVPFGRVVRALQFQRHTLSSRLLWLPLGERWEMNPTLAHHGAEKTSLPPDAMPPDAMPLDALPLDALPHEALPHEALPHELLPPDAPPHEALSHEVIPHDVLQHRALLTLPDGTPFSEVVETYTANVLAFPVPKP